MARTQTYTENRPPYRLLTLLVVALVTIPTVTEGSIDSNPNYAVQVKPITFPREPQSTSVTPNTTASFSCNITAAILISSYSEPHYPLPIIEWRFNGTVTDRQNWNRITEDKFSQLDVVGVGPEDVGYYECLALDGQNYILYNGSFVDTYAHTTVSRRAWLDITRQSTGTTLKAPPVPHVFDYLSIDHLSPAFSIPCLPSGPPNGSVYWYRNGDDLTGDYSYNDTTGNLTVAIPIDISSVLGVYQCFAESGGGVVYSIRRVFRTNFMNPPGNLTCRVEENPDSPGPQVVLNWEPPALFTGRSADIFIFDYIINGLRVDGFIVSQTLQVPLSIAREDDGLYTFRVFSNGNRNNAPAICQVFTPDRITEQEHPLSILSCDGTPYAQWKDPSQKTRLLTTTDVRINATCIHGNQSWENSTTAIDAFELQLSVESNVELTVVDVPSGAVCLFGGFHRYGGEVAEHVIPTDTCIVTVPASAPTPAPTPPPTVRLGLSCESSELLVSWFTNTSECYWVRNITVQGRCLSYSSEWEYDVFTTDTFAGNQTVGQVPGDSVCTFFGFYYDTAGQRQDIEPAQCVGGGPSDERFKLLEPSVIADYPECPSPTSIANTPVTSPSTTPSLPSDNTEDVLWYSLGFSLLAVVAIIVVLLLLLLVCAYKRCQSRDKEEDKMKREIEQFVAEQVTGRREQQSPIRFDDLVDAYEGHFRWYDECSLAETEFDALVRSEHATPTGVTGLVGRSVHSLPNASNEADGKVLQMNKFFESQQDAKWKDTDSGADCERGAAIASGESNQPRSSGSSVREESRLYDVDINASELLQRRIVQLRNSRDTASSGYNSESYYTSDSSGGYPGSSVLGARSYFAEKLTELDEEYPSDSSPSREEGTKTNGAGSKGEAPVIIEEPRSNESSNHDRVVNETVLQIEPDIEIQSTREKPENSCKQTRITRTSEGRRKHRAKSPVLNYSKPLPYYWTDDEGGYVHMDSAGHVDLVDSS